MSRRRLIFLVMVLCVALGVLAARPAPEPCTSTTWPDQRSSELVLPYPVGEAHNVRQGNCDVANTHNQRFHASFAYDFEMPLGSPVTAARAGVVRRVVQRWADTDHDPEHGNLVLVRHDDATYAIYGHLQQGSVRVAVGERVHAGRLLARSGDSGLSRGPHLHFAVLRCGLVWGDLRLLCESVPALFRNTRSHPRGLVGSPTSALGGGEVYLAEPYSSERSR